MYGRTGPRIRRDDIARYHIIAVSGVVHRYQQSDTGKRFLSICLGLVRQVGNCQCLGRAYGQRISDPRICLDCRSGSSILACDLSGSIFIRTGLTEILISQIAVTQNLLDPFQSEIIRKSKTYPRGTSLTFRLNNRNRDYFYDPAWQDAKYYDDKPSRYMKALIEEYASHTLFMREAFYFQESITLTKAAEASGQLLRITMQNAKEEKAEWDIRVYGVLPNDAGLFHYIIGRSVTKGGLKSEERIASFRVSRIQNMRILSASGTRSGRLSKAEKKEIENKIARDGVQFLVGEREECIVKLTEKGKQMYRQIQYMKPNASFIDEEGYYHFECSAYQIFLYFYRFGEHAKVLKPASLREIFADEYRRAWEAYCHIERPEELSNR